MNPAATKPPAAPPNEKPQSASVTIKGARKRGGEYSDINAMALGIAPPMPMPQMKRAIISVLSESAKTISTVGMT